MEFDYVIIGAGSAGCVLANRLSANPNVTVCLLEAGPEDSSPLILHRLASLRSCRADTSTGRSKPYRNLV